MSIKTLMIAAASLASVALPGVASAQAYGNGYRAPVYEQRYNDHRGGDRYDQRRDYRDDHRGNRWEERRRWQEMQRRRAWERAHRHHHGHDQDRYDRDHRGY